jgi:hypothetical protein
LKSSEAWSLAQWLKETLAVGVSAENRFPPVAAIHDVVDRAGVLPAELASHAG